MKTIEDFGMVHESGWDGFAKHLQNEIKKLIVARAGKAEYNATLNPIMNRMGKRYGCNTRSVRAAVHSEYAAQAIRHKIAA